MSGRRDSDCPLDGRVVRLVNEGTIGGKKMAERVQLSRKKGWRMPPNTVKVTRPGVWGNPYRVEVFGLDLALALFENTMDGYWSPEFVASLSDKLAAEAYRLHCETRAKLRYRDMQELRGRSLACWCRVDEACHADVLLRLANR